MFNVQSKTDKSSLVYFTIQTKRLMEKTKKKTIEQSAVRKGSPIGSGGVYGGKDLKEKVSLEFRD